MGWFDGLIDRFGRSKEPDRTGPIGPVLRLFQRADPGDAAFGQIAFQRGQPKQPPAAKKAQPKAAPKAPPAKDRPARPTGRLDGIAEGLSKSQPKSPASKGAPAAATAAEVRRSIDVSIKAAVAPRWNGCRVSGVEVAQLKTVVKFRLTQSGALAGFTSVTTSGETDSNKFQIPRHQECAKRAVELAAPFDLPEENYSFWQNYTLDFIKR